MLFLFVPDVFKFEEAFDIEADDLQEAIEKADEEMSCNCLLQVFESHPFSLHFCGVVEIAEGKSPQFVDHLPAELEVSTDED